MDLDGRLDAVTTWLASQRWFGGKGRDAAVTALTPLAELPGDPEVVVWLAEVTYGDGEVEHYQVPLELRPEPVDALAHQLVVELPEGSVYDALHDRQVSARWLELVGQDATVDRLGFHPEAEDGPLLTPEPGRVLSGEQSNTSLVYGDRLIMKVFRRIAPGLNPDIEVHRALAGRGSSDVATLRGWVDGSWTPAGAPEPVEASFAMVQDFLKSASDGWGLALASVRDLFAEGDLHADEVGGDFAGEAHRLGATTAAVHADLAQVLPSDEATPAFLAGLADGMRRRLDQAVAAAPELAAARPSLERVYDELAALGDGPPVLLQRVHGDLHLGQVMRVSDGWKILDFEGEPARPLADRRSLDSPLRDVAGMLRSFDYAARHLLVGRSRDSQLQHRAEEWSTRNRTAFCDGYAERSGSDPRDSEALLRAFETDKAVYEVAYEARNRPTWLPIPMAAVRRLAGDQ